MHPIYPRTLSQCQLPFGLVTSEAMAETTFDEQSELLCHGFRRAIGRSTKHCALEVPFDSRFTIRSHTDQPVIPPFSK